MREDYGIDLRYCADAYFRLLPITADSANIKAHVRHGGRYLGLVRAARGRVRSF